MTGDFEGIVEGLADAGTGAVVAGAIERERGTTDAGGHSAEGACLNCGTALIGTHCQSCGQRAHVHKTLAAFFHDLLHGVLHLEGKTWRTIPLLVWHPGRLTREYIDGKRATYVSPIALFLFVVFLSFAVWSFLGGGNVGNAASPVSRSQIDATIDEFDADIASTRARRDKIAAKGGDTAELDAELASQENDRDTLTTMLDIPGLNPDRINVRSTALKQDSPVLHWVGATIESFRSNPQLAIYKVQTSAYKYSWMLIPLSVPFVWLLFAFNRRFRGYDHTVFTTYSITFMIALIAAASLLIYFGAGQLGGLLLLFAPIHMYRQLRGTYSLSRRGAIWRMLALSIFAWIAILLFAALITWMAAGH